MVVTQHITFPQDPSLQVTVLVEAYRSIEHARVTKHDALDMRGPLLEHGHGGALEELAHRLVVVNSRLFLKHPRNRQRSVGAPPDVERLIALVLPVDRLRDEVGLPDDDEYFMISQQRFLDTNKCV